jgi:hypothetical protein
MGNPFSANQGQIVPDFDCNHTMATGGLGGGQVTPVIAGQPGNESNPPAQEGVYPLNQAVLPALGGPGGLFANPPFNTLPPPLGGPGGILEGLDPTDLTTNPLAAARAPCVTQTNAMGNFPAEFGGGRLPQVLADP